MNTGSNSDLCLIKPRPNAGARVRLVCFPYAGGAPHTFHNWPSFLPQSVEVIAVNLPGRGRRIAESPCRNMKPVVSEVVQSLAKYAGEPIALFGHSMGALLAFEVARELRRKAGITPLQLFTSGCYAPHLPDPNPIHHLSEPAFLQELKKLGGMPDEILADAELLNLVLPTVRADFELTETYTFLPESPLACPITAFCGTNDPMGTPEAVGAWRQHTSSTFVMRSIPGDHFFLQSAQNLVLSGITNALLPYLNKLAWPAF